MAFLLPVRAVLFALLLPGTVTLVVPCLILTGGGRPVPWPASALAWLGALALYAAGVVASAHLFVVECEEPTLRRRFGGRSAATPRRCRGGFRGWPREAGGAARGCSMDASRGRM